MQELEECLELMLLEIQPAQRTEYVALTEAAGRVISEDIVADRMIPPYPKSAMDGYAVRAEDTFGADSEQPVRLRVVGELFAGDYDKLSCEKGCAVRVILETPWLCAEGEDKKTIPPYKEEIALLRA